MRTRVLAVCLVAACGAEPGAGAGASAGAADAGLEAVPTVGAFDPAITRVTLEIDYETGQAPYTGMVAGGGDVFDPTVSNLDRLFSGTRALDVPRTLGEMSDVGPVADEELTIYDLRELAAQHRDLRDTGDTKTLYVLFVSGTFSNDQGPQPRVLGVEVDDTIALFKDVIRTTSPVPSVLRFVEQTTLIHELGHAVGLVDDGVTMQSSHKDLEHGAHCTNPDCVMYWLNNSGGDVTAFVQRRFGDGVLFGPECLADVDARTAGR